MSYVRAETYNYTYKHVGMQSASAAAPHMQLQRRGRRLQANYAATTPHSETAAGGSSWLGKSFSKEQNVHDRIRMASVRAGSALSGYCFRVCASPSYVRMLL